MFLLECELKNKRFRDLASDCGIVFDDHSPQATGGEIEFLLEEVVRECITVLHATLPQHSAQDAEAYLRRYYDDFKT